MRIARLESRQIGATQPTSTRRSGSRSVRWIVLSTLVAVAVAVAALALAGAARADIGETIILRCTHAQSLSGFSQAAYRKALKELSADSEEYSPCSAQIRRAQQAAAAAGRGGGAGATSTAAAVAIAPTASEQKSIVHAQGAGGEPVNLGGQVIHPGVVHVDVASALSSLPSPVLATLAFLIACLLLIVGGAISNRVRARRSG
jgi:hypothetical protein